MNNTFEFGHLCISYGCLGKAEPKREHIWWKVETGKVRRRTNSELENMIEGKRHDTYYAQKPKSK